MWIDAISGIRLINYTGSVDETRCSRAKSSIFHCYRTHTVNSRINFNFREPYHRHRRTRIRLNLMSMMWMVSIRADPLSPRVPTLWWPDDSLSQFFRPPPRSPVSGCWIHGQINQSLTFVSQLLRFLLTWMAFCTEQQLFAAPWHLPTGRVFRLLETPIRRPRPPNLTFSPPLRLCGSPRRLPLPTSWRMVSQKLRRQPQSLRPQISSGSIAFINIAVEETELEVIPIRNRPYFLACSFWAGFMPSFPHKY